MSERNRQCLLLVYSSATYAPAAAFAELLHKMLQRHPETHLMSAIIGHAAQARHAAYLDIPIFYTGHDFLKGLLRAQKCLDDLCIKMPVYASGRECTPHRARQQRSCALLARANL